MLSCINSQRSRSSHKRQIQFGINFLRNQLHKISVLDFPTHSARDSGNAKIIPYDPPAENRILGTTENSTTGNAKTDFLRLLNEAQHWTSELQIEFETKKLEKKINRSFRAGFTSWPHSRRRCCRGWLKNRTAKGTIINYNVCQVD